MKLIDGQWVTFSQKRLKQSYRRMGGIPVPGTPRDDFVLLSNKQDPEDEEGLAGLFNRCWDNHESQQALRLMATATYNIAYLTPALRRLVMQDEATFSDVDRLF